MRRDPFAMWPGCEKVIGQMDHDYAKRPTTNCALCHLLFTTRVYKSDMVSDRELYSQEPGDQWCLLPIPNSETIFDTGGIACLAPISPSRQWKSEIYNYTRQLRISTLPVVQVVGSSSPRSVISRPIRSVMAYEEIQECLLSCKKKHIRCLKSSFPRMPLWLIDCRDRALHFLSTDEEYTALSYVWGQVTVSRASGGHLPGALPRTIEDALELTLAIGIRYLWVDQFCVNQVDTAIKHKQIRSMGRVYGKAVITLVAACGKDASHGLPGVASHPRRGSPSLLINGCTISPYLPDPIHTANGSTWNTRGWTYQEAYLSRRLLIIGEEQFVYQCGEASHSEQCGPWNRMSYEDQNELSELNVYETANVESVSDGESNDIMERYQRMVEQFSRRELRFDNDAIFACAAILEHVKTAWNLELERRHPEAGLDLTFIHGMPSVVSQLEEGRQTPQGLSIWAASLLFIFSRIGFGVRRREKFPSWSWAGYAIMKNHEDTRHVENRASYMYWRRSWLSNDSVLLKNAHLQDDGSMSTLTTSKDVEPLDASNILVLDVCVIPPGSFHTAKWKARLKSIRRRFLGAVGVWYLPYQRLSKMLQRREPDTELFSYCEKWDPDPMHSNQSSPKEFEGQVRRGILVLAALTAHESHNEWEAYCLVLKSLDHGYHERIGVAIIKGISRGIDGKHHYDVESLKEGCTSRTLRVK
ncbi:kinase phosphorylation protein [Apiospora arundinis]